MRITTFLCVLGLGIFAAACTFRGEGAHHPSLDGMGLAEGMGSSVQSALIGSDYDRPHAPSPNYRAEDESMSTDDESDVASEKQIDLW